MPHLPPSYPTGPAPQQPAKKRSSKALGLSIVFALIALCCLGGVIIAVVGADKGEPRGLNRIEEVQGEPTTALGDESSEPAAPTSTPTAKPKPRAVVLEAGTYELGKTTDADAGVIAAGTWKISTPDDGINCYWARLKNFDGELTSIRSNGNVAAGSTARVTLKASDAGLELLGDCLARK